MRKLGERLKRPFQRLSRSTTPEPSPDPSPGPPINVAPNVTPASPGSAKDPVTGAPLATHLSIHSPQPMTVATTPVSNPPTLEAGVGRATWTGLKLFGGVLGESAAVFGPLKQAVDTFAEFIGVYETSMEARQEYKTLRAELDGLFHDLAGAFGESVPPGMRPSIVNLARGIEQEISFFRRKEHGSTLSRYAEASQDGDQVLYHCRRIQALLERLTLNANINIWMLVDEQATTQRLKGLSPSHAARYDSAESEEISRDECTPDTRVEVLERFRVWQDDGKSEKVYWLNGMAGTGKTTLAYTLCKQLDDDNRLAANFFCARQLPSCRDAKLILPTIAYQLSNFSYPFRYALSQILDQNPEVHTRRISKQFEELLYKPLHEVQHSLPCNLVVVIDGLDECENDHGVGEIIDALLHHVPDMPIKFFLTSRPETVIRGRMLRRQGDRDRFELHLHELDKGVVREDIKRYLQASLKHPDFTLSEQDLETLTERSGVLFIYAATVVRYIGVDDFSRSAERLADVLEATMGSNDSDQGISSLYNMILKRAFEFPHLIARDRNEMRLVLETVICAQEPSTVRVMAGLLGLKRERSVDAALGLLRSVLNVQPDGIITTLHKSFPDHMLDRSRFLDFYCDPKKRNGWLARRCLDLINTPCDPPFNVCGLGPSSTLDNVLYLDQTIKHRVSGPLFYACRYWAVHLRLAERPQDILEELHGFRRFLPVRLFLWMEVVNLTKFMHPGVEISSRVNIPEWGKRTEWKMITEAVAVAISLQQYDLALEWLEQGRAILWSQMLQMPTPYDNLYAGHPEMLKELQRVFYQPKYAGISEPAGVPSAHDGRSLDGDSRKHGLAERKQELLDFARRLPGLEDTLRPPKASKLVSLLQDGAAVILNLDEDRCDALVIRAGSQEITHVPLIRFSVQEARGWFPESTPTPGEGAVIRRPIFSSDGDTAGIKGDIKGVLAPLWHDAIKPVLDHIGITFQHVPPAGSLPHITWCTTGPLSSLPLHAAGVYDDGGPALPNLAISSYIPMLSLLGQRTSTPSMFSGILAVGLAASIKNYPFLPGVEVELNQVQMLANHLPFTRLEGENACRDTVLKAMANHSWVHFACHGSQAWPIELMKAALHLHDGDLDLATITRYPIQNAQLAFLSTCGGDIGQFVESLSECTPLALGLLMAGYPTVIATMWTIHDQDAPIVAGKIYERLLEGGVPDSRKAAEALHEAVTSLHEKVGVEEFRRWVPYVHLGV
ncbi:hypothetical protein FS749_001488 [Ceratobasidium sp. UAMH 11750]|nr:hypothetical protein FS749_001488 [Ceratobasidium sp. UAMH 11750]